jgi:hypothetical protein
MNNKMFTLLRIAIVALTVCASYAQSPAPLVSGAEAKTTAAPASTNANMQETMKSLRELKAANEQILKKQQATLEALDELQKAAEQMKIFSKRG